MAKMITVKEIAEYGKLFFKFSFDVLLPISDLITDVIFTITLFLRQEKLTYFILSGILLLQVSNKYIKIKFLNFESFILL